MVSSSFGAVFGCISAINLSKKTHSYDKSYPPHSDVITSPECHYSGLSNGFGFENRKKRSYFSE